MNEHGVHMRAGGVSRRRRAPSVLLAASLPAAGPRSTASPSVRVRRHPDPGAERATVKFARSETRATWSSRDPAPCPCWSLELAGLAPDYGCVARGRLRELRCGRVSGGGGGAQQQLDGRYGVGLLGDATRRRRRRRSSWTCEGRKEAAVRRLGFETGSVRESCEARI